MRRFSVLVQRAERAIAQANQPVRSGPLWGFETPQAVREGLIYNELKGFRSAHNSLTDEEFEELAGDDTDEPMTRRQLQEIAQEKRALALEPENEEDGLERGGPGLGPDAVEEIVARIGGQVRDIVAQLPVRSGPVLEIVGEDLRGLEKRLQIIEQCVWRLTERNCCITLADAGTVSDRLSVLRRSPDCTSRAWR